MCFGIRPASPLPRPMETGRRQNKDGMGRETGPCQRSAGISAPDDGTKRMENLNGLWDYAIRPCGEAEPKTYDGEILVPFAVEIIAIRSRRALGRQSGIVVYTAI